jgi:phage major head subunit gpT-like protein
LRFERKGGIRHCQGTVLADWVALTSDGDQRASGTNVFVLGMESRIASVTGFWNQLAER